MGARISNLQFIYSNKIGHSVRTFTSWWASQNLAYQFALIGSLVVIAGMLVIGSWVSREIQTTVTQNTAASTALYMDSIIAPHLQELSVDDTLSERSQASLDKLFKDSNLGKNISSTKIWKQDGLIAYSNRKSIIGENFPITPSLTEAWSGVISAEFDSLENEEDAAEKTVGIPFLEIYSPIRSQPSGEIIAVAEFYANAKSLKSDLLKAQLSTWIVVGLVTLSMIGLLSGIVLKGSRTIENQRFSLQERIDQLTSLRDRIENSSRLSTELNERFLRRVGADLHDGPAQLIGLALLRLDAIRSNSAESTAAEYEDVEVVRRALNDALSEIRNVSAGLTLPELETQPLENGLSRIVSMHEQRTDTKVLKEIENLPEIENNSIKISLYRLVQEGLNNAFRHASGGQAKVTANFRNETIEIAVSDKGSGFDLENQKSGDVGLGLPGLRERIESIGGSFAVETGPGQGTTLTARFVIGEAT